jgi:hypothetical protein
MPPGFAETVFRARSRISVTESFAIDFLVPPKGLPVHRTRGMTGSGRATGPIRSRKTGRVRFQGFHHGGTEGTEQTGRQESAQELTESTEEVSLSSSPFFLCWVWPLCLAGHGGRSRNGRLGGSCRVAKATSQSSAGRYTSGRRGRRPYWRWPVSAAAPLVFHPGDLGDLRAERSDPGFAS